MQGFTEHDELTVNAPALAQNGDVPAVQEGFAHVHPHGGDQAVRRLHLGLYDASQGFHPHSWRRMNARFKDVLGETADAVAAHLRLTAVGIDDAHAHIRALALEQD